MFRVRSAGSVNQDSSACFSMVILDKFGCVNSFHEPVKLQSVFQSKTFNWTETNKSTIFFFLKLLFPWQNSVLWQIHLKGTQACWETWVIPLKLSGYPTTGVKRGPISLNIAVRVQSFVRKAPKFYIWEILLIRQKSSKSLWLCAMNQHHLLLSLEVCLIYIFWSWPNILKLKQVKNVKHSWTQLC